MRYQASIKKMHNVEHINKEIIRASFISNRVRLARKML